MIRSASTPTSPTRAASFTVTLPSDPRGWARPRFVRAGPRLRAYRDPAEVAYADALAVAWFDAGRLTLPPGPFGLTVVAAFTRPARHYTRAGDLSAAGRRSIAPTRRPDADNIAKLVADALGSVGAVPDDAGLVDLAAHKRWATNEPGLTVHAWTLVGAELAALDALFVDDDPAELAA